MGIRMGVEIAHQFAIWRPCVISRIRTCRSNGYSRLGGPGDLACVRHPYESAVRRSMAATDQVFERARWLFDKLAEGDSARPPFNHAHYGDAYITTQAIQDASHRKEHNPLATAVI